MVVRSILSAIKPSKSRRTIHKPAVEAGQSTVPGNEQSSSKTIDSPERHQTYDIYLTGDKTAIGKTCPPAQILELPLARDILLNFA